MLRNFIISSSRLLVCLSFFSSITLTGRRDCVRMDIWQVFIQALWLKVKWLFKFFPFASSIISRFFLISDYSIFRWVTVHTYKTSFKWIFLSLSALTICLFRIWFLFCSDICYWFGVLIIICYGSGASAETSETAQLYSRWALCADIVCSKILRYFSVIIYTCWSGNIYSCFCFIYNWP